MNCKSTSDEIPYFSRAAYSIGKRDKPRQLFYLHPSLHDAMDEIGIEIQRNVGISLFFWVLKFWQVHRNPLLKPS